MKLLSRNRVVAVFFLSIPVFALAEEPVESTLLPEMVITATRGATPAQQVGSTVTVISAEQIDKSQKSSVAEILRTVPGMDVVRSGGPGQSVSIFTRGTDSNHTLVLIDGIEATDPSNPSNAFDFSGLQVDDIERIEIVRGPQSTLYGSDAIGGVIQIFTKHGVGTRSSAQLETGSFGSHAAHGGVHGGDKWANYGLTFNLQKTDGVSAFPDGSEDDGYKNTTLSTYVSAKPTAESTVDFTLRRIEFDTDLDDFDSVTFAFGDDPDTRQNTEQWLARIQGGYSLFDGRWNQRLGLSYTDHDRSSETGAAPVNTTPGKSRFEGRKTKLDWVHDFKVDSNHQLTFGLESEKEKAELSGGLSPDTGTDGIFLQDHFRITDAFYTTVGVRHDKHEDFGGETTYRLAPSYVIADTDTRLRASYGTGFKAPSLSELFESFPAFFFFANPNLKPERSRGWDVGIEQTLLDEALQLELTYYRSEIEDLIDFVFDPVTFDTTAQNIDKATTKGYELTARYKVLPTVTIGANYTRSRAVDKTSDEDLLRRPRKKYGLFADWQALPELSVNISGRYVGERDDMDFAVFPFQRVTLDSYKILDVALAYTLTPQWTLLTRLENTTDEEYEEALDLGTSGRAWFAGVRFTP